MKRNYYTPECSFWACEEKDVIATSKDLDIIVNIDDSFWGTGIGR